MTERERIEEAITALILLFVALSSRLTDRQTQRDTGVPRRHSLRTWNEGSLSPSFLSLCLSPSVAFSHSSHQADCFCNCVYTVLLPLLLLY